MKKFWMAIYVIIFLSISLKAHSEIRATASSVQESYFPQKAVDGNTGTRWGSEFLNNQWLMLDLGELKIISGLTLHWEAAYAEHYKILLSKDGNNWINVYEMKRGDGKTDEIYFSPKETRFIKIFCVKRATGWGNSLWEVKIKGEEDIPIIEASSYKDENKPSNIMDGDFNTPWISKSGKSEWIEVDLKKKKGIGGFQLNWGKNHAKEYEILISQDKKNWNRVYEAQRSNGGRDLIYIDKTQARYIKINCKQSSNNSFSLNELTLKGNDEFATPQKAYEVLAEESPPGYFPKWIYKKQAYWTVAGLDEDKKESLISADGTIEAYKGSFTIMPYIYLNDKLITSADCKVSQKLEYGYLPIPTVTWDYKGIILRQKMFTYGKKGESTTYVWYELINNNKQTKEGNLYITVRPIQLNPKWQYGGMSKIHSIESEEKNSSFNIRINSKDSIILLDKPDEFGATYLKRNEIIEYVAYNKLPKDNSVKDKEDLASCAAKYSFKLEPRVKYNYEPSPKAKKDIFFILPLYKDSKIKPITSKDPKEIFKKTQGDTINYWQKKLSKIEIDIPQEELIDVLKANLIYLLINSDDSALQPGSRNYDRSWMRDGAIMAASLLRTGFYNEVKDYLNWVSKQQKPSGEIPCILESNGRIPDFSRDWKEWDGQGAYVFAISEYYRFTKDKEFLKEKFPNIIKALKFLEALRKKRLTDKYKGTYFYGILPESNSHEGYFPAQHSLWDDFWALKGWEDGQFIAKILGREDVIDWMRQEEKGLRKNLLKDIELIQKQKNIKYIPGCFEKGDFDATSTAISVWPTQQARYLQKKDLMHTLNRYYGSTFYPRLQHGLRKPYTPYEMRTATAYLMLGEKTKALNMVNYFLQDMRPRAWCHWGEVVHEDYSRPQYIGDMPHAWIGAIYINLIRSLFIYEDNNSLVLAAGVDNNWLNSKRTVMVKNLPTYYGDLSYTIKRVNNKLVFKAWGDVDPPGGFILNIPIEGKISQAKINGKIIKNIKDKNIKFEKLPVNIVIYYR